GAGRVDRQLQSDYGTTAVEPGVAPSFSAGWSSPGDLFVVLAPAQTGGLDGAGALTGAQRVFPPFPAHAGGAVDRHCGAGAVGTAGTGRLVDVVSHAAVAVGPPGAGGPGGGRADAALAAVCVRRGRGAAGADSHRAGEYEAGDADRPAR